MHRHDDLALQIGRKRRGRLRRPHLRGDWYAVVRMSWRPWKVVTGARTGADVAPARIYRHLRKAGIDVPAAQRSDHGEVGRAAALWLSAGTEDGDGCEEG
jgi:hypothetical protein